MPRSGLGLERAPVEMVVWKEAGSAVDGLVFEQAVDGTAEVLELAEQVAWNSSPSSCGRYGVLDLPIGSMSG